MLQRLNVIKNWRSIVVLGGLLLAIAVIGAQPSLGKPLNAMDPGQGSHQAQKGHGAAVGAPSVGQAARFHVSQPLRDIPFSPPVYNPNRHEGPENPILPDNYASKWVQDTIVQKAFGPLGATAMPTPIQNFDGMYNYWGPLPPDTNGEVGPNHYVQIVNEGFQVFSKSGLSLYGPVDTNVLFRGLGGPCATRNDGDPIVLYDQLADRWNISQFTSASPYMQCIAISTSGDPLGSWYQYAFQESTTVFGDYPHLGVWPDGYYMTVNQFNGGSGGGNYAFERPKMLVGDPNAQMVYFNTPSIGGGLPTDLDGSTLPPAGTPNFFLFRTSSSQGILSEYKFHVDWTTPLSSTFTGPITMTVQPWTSGICDAPRGGCIDQPGTSAKLESISDRFMFRVAYRNMGDHEALVANYTVNATGANPGVAGLRWYEIRSPNGTPTVYQQGTYQPDNTHRWMGSIAMDRDGNIALGYSASSSVISPSLRYTGRLATDPLNTLPQGEGILFQGHGVENFTAAPRWGDYSDLTVDPTDDCTFWYTNEYFQQVGNRNWRTRIGSFKFPTCGAGAVTPSATTVATLTPTVTPTRCPLCATYTGSLTSGDPMQIGRLTASSPSVCNVGRGCPGLYGSESPPVPRHYDVYTYTNSSTLGQCVTVNIGEACGDNHLRSTAYLDTWNPNSICQNYRADHGGVGSINFSYAFTLEPGHSAIVVVYEGTGNIYCDSYTLNIRPSGGVPTLTPTITRTPTITPTPLPPCGSGADYVIDSSTGATIDPGTTLVAGTQCDDCTTLITLPFTFKFYNQSFTTARLSSNGNIQFASNNNGLNTCLPASSLNYAIMADWTDLDMTASLNPGYGIYTSTTGSAPNRVFNVEWRGEVFGTSTHVSFEVRLLETGNSDNLQMVYGTTMQDNGSSGTVGVQRTNGVSYSQYSCNTTSLQPGLLLSLHPLGCAEPTRTPTVTPTTCVMNFSDVPTANPFYDFIYCLYCRGAITGYKDGTFRPYDTTTRGQVTKMMVIAFDMPINTTGGPHFTDVPVSYVFYPYVETANNTGLITGYSDKTFHPGDDVTRGQLAKIVVQAAVANLGWVVISPTTQRFTDVPPSDVFYKYIETAVCHQIISGYSDNTFKPGDSAARAHVAKLICLAVRNLVSCNGNPPPKTPTITPTATRTGTPTNTVTNTPTITLTPMPTRAPALVSIVNFAFQPQTLNITAGTTVRWTNTTGGTTHTSTSDTGPWDSGNIAPGGTFERSFSTPGSYAYYCEIHPTQMTGTIVVTAP